MGYSGLHAATFSKHCAEDCVFTHIDTCRRTRSGRGEKIFKIDISSWLQMTFGGFTNALVMF